MVHFTKAYSVILPTLVSVLALLALCLLSYHNVNKVGLFSTMKKQKITAY